MGWIRHHWKTFLDRRMVADLIMLLTLGASTFMLARAGATLRPGESAVLLVTIAGLLLLGRRWLAWQFDLGTGSFVADWARRIQEGERRLTPVPSGLHPDADLMARTLNTVLQDMQEAQTELKHLRKAVATEWRDLDGLLDTLQRQEACNQEALAQGEARFTGFAQTLKSEVEETFRVDQMELDHRLRADQQRLQGQAFLASLEQVQSGLDLFQDLLEELRDTFPRLRREEDALGRLADAGLRQGGKLAVATQGLVAQTPHLLEQARIRTEQLRRFRQSADGLRDRAEALGRRLEAFRDESQRRIRSFAGAQGSLRAIDHVAQQTGLLAVNASILAQQGGGGAGLQAIGGRLRGLATQTATGTAELERALDQHQQGLERETAGIWNMTEATQNLLAGVQECLQMAGQLDQQGQDLERALESHLGLVDQVRLASGQAGLSLHEIRERATAIETALVRQWGVEAKMVPERERLSRVGHRLGEVGGSLAKSSQRHVDEVWNLLGRHQTFRRSEAYAQIVDGSLGRMVSPIGRNEAAWRRLAWARIQRRPRLAELTGAWPPLGRMDAEGRVRLLLLGRDALDHPEASALESWSSDAAGRVWDLRLLKSLRTEGHRLALMEGLKDSALMTCLPGSELRIHPEGVEVRLPLPYLGLPDFLAGLELELLLEEGLLDPVLRPPSSRPLPVQHLVWFGPDLAEGPRRELSGLIHSWVRDDLRHEQFLGELPYEGRRPPCPWHQEGQPEERLTDSPRIRCLALGTEGGEMHPIRDRLLAAGALEGNEGVALCAIRITHRHPEALLLRLFQAGAGLAEGSHPEVAPLRARFEAQVLSGGASDTCLAAWQLIEELQRKGWMMPLPPA